MDMNFFKGKKGKSGFNPPVASPYPQKMKNGEESNEEKSEDRDSDEEMQEVSPKKPSSPKKSKAPVKNTLTKKVSDTKRSKSPAKKKVTIKAGDKRTRLSKTKPLDDKEEENVKKKRKPGSRTNMTRSLSKMRRLQKTRTISNLIPRQPLVRVLRDVNKEVADDPNKKYNFRPGAIDYIKHVTFERLYRRLRSAVVHLRYKGSKMLTERDWNMVEMNCSNIPWHKLGEDGMQKCMELLDRKSTIKIE